MPSIARFAFLVIILSIHLLLTRSRKICFYDNEPNGRGTANAMYDYADYTEKLWGHTAHMIFPSRSHSDYTSLEKFKSRFNVTLYVAGPKSVNGLGGPEV